MFPGRDFGCYKLLCLGKLCQNTSATAKNINEKSCAEKLFLPAGKTQFVGSWKYFLLYILLYRLTTSSSITV